MESSLHQDNRDTSEVAKDKTTGVTRGGADGEVGDGVVGEDGGLLDQAGEAA